MQLVDTPSDSERVPARPRAAQRTRTTGTGSPEIVTPLKLELPTRRVRTSVGERAPERVVALEATPLPASDAAEAGPKRRRTRKSEAPATAESVAQPEIIATPLAAEPEAAPKRRRSRKVEAVAAPEASPAASPRRRTRKVEAIVVPGAPVVKVAATEASPTEAPKRRRTRKAAEAEAAPQPEIAPVQDLGAEFVPTITRVRFDRRGGRVVTDEKRLDPGELLSLPRRRRGRRLRRAQLTAELEASTPSPLAAEPRYVTGFGGLTMTEQTAAALEAMNYHEPTEIQALAIPLLLEGKDIVGQAQTGTGKTAAFGIPLVERIDPTILVVQALVLAPTRELASQISQELGRIGRRRGVRVAAIYGGASMGGQLSELKRGAQVVVGTPGRILDHLKRGTLSFESVSYLVLDEADRMLDMGFMPDVERILRRTPRSRQTSLFSATIPTVVRIISRRHMRDAVTVQVKPEERTVKEVEQIFYEVAERDKPEALRAVLKEQTPERAMVFCRTQIAVDRLTRILRRDGLPVEAIHGSMGQGQRERVIADFRRGAISLLVATNLAARGLDIPEVSHVINYDIPEESESYVHRIGRTARMGREGMAITFVAEWDEKSLAEIKKVVNGALRQERLSLYA